MRPSRRTRATELIHLIVRDLVARGWRFEPGSIAMAVTAAERAWGLGPHQLADKIEGVLIGSRVSFNPFWDGSIA